MYIPLTFALEYIEIVLSAAAAAILTVSVCSGRRTSPVSRASPPSRTTASAVAGSMHNLARAMADLLTVLSVAATSAGSFLFLQEEARIRTRRERDWD